MRDLINTLWQWVRTDGLLHILAVIAVGLTLAVWGAPLWLVVVAQVAVSVGKGAWDYSGHGTIELHDAVCDLIGIIYTIEVCLI